MKTNIKDNIWIEGFSTPLKRDNRILDFLEKGHCENGNWVVDSPEIVEIIYSGKTSEITEEVAKKCVGGWDYAHIDYQNIGEYAGYGGDAGCFRTAKNSIQSACDQEFCIIYEIK